MKGPSADRLFRMTGKMPVPPGKMPVPPGKMPVPPDKMLGKKGMGGTGVPPVRAIMPRRRNPAHGNGQGVRGDGLLNRHQLSVV